MSYNTNTSFTPYVRHRLLHTSETYYTEMYTLLMYCNYTKPLYYNIIFTLYKNKWQC